MASIYPMYVKPPPPRQASAPQSADAQDATGRQSQDDGARRGSAAPMTNIVFTDPVAFRFLEEDPATLV
ncbi:hypothetical protein KEM52_003950, partial [Ascosphaera acerosa]